jgi:hypothetical protein
MRSTTSRGRPGRSGLLPTDGAEFGFDNIATALKTSPMLMEGYVNAAQRISAMAVGDPQVAPGTAEYLIPREFSQNGYVEGLPLGTRGGTVVRHVFSADAEYNLAGHLIRGIAEGYSGVEGNDIPFTFIITLDGKEVYSTSIGGPKDHDVQGDDINVARTIIDKRLVGRVRVTAGPHDVGFTFKERPFQMQDIWQPSKRDSQEIHMTGGEPKLRTVGIDGPYKVFGLRKVPAGNASMYVSRDRGGGDNCAAKIFTNLAHRAYRRPVTPADVEAPVSFYQNERKNGGNFDDGIRAGVARILSSLYFLYRIETDPAGARAGEAHAVSDVELASRLSFFLWSSIPDETLLNLAEAGRLRQPAVLASEVQRMLADDRAGAFVENFTGQWLQLRNLEAKVTPDLLTFPDFDDNIRKGFRKETEMLFSYILRNNRSALELMNADYTFVDERLADHYGIKGVYGPRFRRVTYRSNASSAGPRKHLAMTAVSTRTSRLPREIRAEHFL